MRLIWLRARYTAAARCKAFLWNVVGAKPTDLASACSETPGLGAPSKCDANVLCLSDWVAGCRAMACMSS